jgi:hypothetical protein
MPEQFGLGRLLGSFGGFSGGDVTGYGQQVRQPPDVIPQRGDRDLPPLTDPCLNQ